MKRILPSMTNEIITLIKDTSLSYVVAVAEMFTLAKQIASSQTTMMPFIIAAVFTMCSICWLRLSCSGWRRH